LQITFLVVLIALPGKPLLGRSGSPGHLSFLFFFLTLVIHGNPGATRQKWAGKGSHGVNTVLCHQIDLPVFILVTPPHLHDSQIDGVVVSRARTWTMG
jgi:hypothetical protein